MKTTKTTINIIQNIVDKWIKEVGVKYFSPLTNMAILSEEVGEVARLISRKYGEQSFKNPTNEEESKQMLGEELSDVLFVITCLANQCDIDLGKAFDEKMDKRTKRDKIRHKQNPKLSG